MVMNLLFLNKALLWKEWRQNRLIFGFFFMLMSLPIANNIRLWLMYTETPPRFINGEPIGWLSSIMFKGIASYLDRPGMLLAIALGIILLSQERNGNILFLMSTPVSRKEIIRAKFFMGVATIVATMLFNILFLAIIWLLLPFRYTFYDVLLVFSNKSLVLLALYSFSFCLSCIAGNVMSASLLTLGMPAFITSAFYRLKITKFFLNWDNTLYNKIINFILSPIFVDSVEKAHKALWKIPYLLIVIIVFYLLADYSFKRNIMENNGRFIVIGKNIKIVKITITVIAVYLITQLLFEIFKGFQFQKSLDPTIIGILGIVIVAIWQIFSFIVNRR